MYESNIRWKTILAPMNGQLPGKTFIRLSSTPPLTLGLALVRQVHQNRNVHPLRKSGLKSLARASLVCADLSRIPGIATTEAGDLVR